MEVVINIEFLKGLNKEDVVKEIGLASGGVIQSFHFQSPYVLHQHGSEKKGLSFDDEHLPYNQLYTVLSEAIAHYDHLCARGTTKG
jgi:hypothetical protein